MKKIKSLRLASILLIGTLLTTCLLGGTFAKYTTAASGSSNATVANWSIRANDQEIAVSPQIGYNFAVFDTINDADGESTEQDVVDNRIAPGTGGSFDMTVQNKSEVSAKYSIALTETNELKVPIQYSLDGTNWYDSISKISEDKLTDLVLQTNSSKVTHTLYWRWAFDSSTANAPALQNDASDSQIGHPADGSTAKVIVTATITASQVD